MDSLKFLCDFLETLTDVVNAMVDTSQPVSAYGVISNLPPTGQVPPHTHRNLTYIECYMDDVISAVQDGPELKHQLFDSTVHALKWMFPSLPGEAKDLVGGWTCVNEFLGWIIDTKAETVALLESKLQELQYLLDIPTTPQQMGRKELENLVGEIRSMYLGVPGVVSHLYHLQQALAQGGVNRK